MSTPLINYICIWRKGINPRAGQIKLIVTLHSSIYTCENACCVRNNSSSSVADTTRTIARENSDKQDNQLVLTNTVLYRAALQPCTRAGALQVIPETVSIYKVKTKASKNPTQPTYIFITVFLKSLTICQLFLMKTTPICSLWLPVNTCLEYKGHLKLTDLWLRTLLVNPFTSTPDRWK